MCVRVCVRSVDGNQAAKNVEVSNRDLLLEFCHGNSVQVANTFFQTALEEKVTFFSPGATPLGPISENAKGYHLPDLVVLTGQVSSYESKPLAWCPEFVAELLADLLFRVRAFGPTFGYFAIVLVSGQLVDRVGCLVDFLLLDLCH